MPKIPDCICNTLEFIGIYDQVSSCLYKYFFKTINSHVVITSFEDFNTKIWFKFQTKITETNILDHNQVGMNLNGNEDSCWEWLCKIHVISQKNCKTIAVVLEQLWYYGLIKFIDRGIGKPKQIFESISNIFKE